MCPVPFNPGSQIPIHHYGGVHKMLVAAEEKGVCDCQLVQTVFEHIQQQYLRNAGHKAFTKCLAEASPQPKLCARPARPVCA